jgi:hypothetical protein
MIVGATSQEPKGHSIQRQFLYADYTPLGDNRNLVEMLKDFVSLTGKLIRLHIDNEKLVSTLKTAESLRQDVVIAVKQLRTNTVNAMDWFHNKHPDALISNLHTSSAALLNDVGKTISSLLDNTESGFDEQHEKYKENIMSRVGHNNRTAVSMLESWLSADYKNFPALMLSSISAEWNLIIESTDLKGYAFYRNASTKQRGRNTTRNKEKNAMNLNYVFRIDTSESEFWHNVKRISEFGLKDLMLPIGMKAPISQKLKKAFSFGSRKDNDVVMEPEFVKVDDYYLLSCRLDGEKTLFIQLVPDLAKPEDELIEITYDISNFLSLCSQYADSKAPSGTARPAIKYKSRKNGQSLERTDLLQIKEIAQACDDSRIWFLGTTILDKLRILQNANIVSSVGKLQLLKANDSDILMFDAEMKVNFALLFELLSFMASAFTPLIKNLKERTPVGGELILREEVEKGQRKEYTVRLDDLKSQLPATHYCGRSVLEILQL